MSVFDVRGNGVGAVTEIVYAEPTWDGDYKITKCTSDGIILHNEDDDETYISSVDALNLIKALEKAVALGWIKTPVAKKAAPVKKPVASKVVVKK